MNRRDVALLVLMALLLVGLTMIGDAVDSIKASVARMAGEREYGVTVFEDGSVVWAHDKYGSGYLCLPGYPCDDTDVAFEENPR